MSDHDGTLYLTEMVITDINIKKWDNWYLEANANT